MSLRQVPLPDGGRKFRVGILGATGTVGQRFIFLICAETPHPWFEVATLGASDRSVGKAYKDAVNWKISSDIPENVANMTVQACDPSNFATCDFVFSGMDATFAGPTEEAFAKYGISVFSNSKNHRYDAHVPILVPVVNANHLEAVRRQSTYKTSGGFIATNPNCSATGLSAALGPIHHHFGLSRVIVATLQAISGSGYPGLPSMDIHDNCVPFINGEEPKVEFEPKKILGSLTDLETETSFQLADFAVSAHCHRISVTDGHLASVSIELKQTDRTKGKSKEQLAKEICALLTTYLPDEDILSLPSCPHPPLRVRPEEDRPQPRLDRMESGGQGTVVGRVRPCEVFDVRFTCLAHNTIMGAAGGSLLNAEVAVKRNILRRRGA